MNLTDVFISHSSNDSAFAEQVITLLNECIDFDGEGIVCTSTEGYGFEFGTKFERELRESIAAADVVVALISPNSLASLFCTFEMGAAWGLEKTIKPILLPDVQKSSIQRPLSSLHFLEWSNEKGWARLVREIAKASHNKVRVKKARLLELAKCTSAYRGTNPSFGTHKA